MNSNILRTLRGQLLREVTMLLLFAGLMLQSGQAAAPGWWSTQSVFKPQVQADDYAAANVGQLKAMAAKAAKEMNEQIQQGAGSEINTLIASWRTANAALQRDDFAALTVGQLKAVAKPFFDRLAVIGGLDQAEYPWPNGEAADDYALANIGQLKAVFSFLVPYQIWRLGDPNNPSPDDLNWNGISDAYEASRGWNNGTSISSGLSAQTEAWNNATNDVDNGDVDAGVYMTTSFKSGTARAFGFGPFTELGADSSYEDGFVFYTSMSFDISLNSDITTEKTYSTVGEFWSNGTSSDHTESEQTLTAEINISNPIYTNQLAASGVNAGVTDVSLAASMSGSRNYTSNDSGNYAFTGVRSWQETTTESWSGSDSLSGQDASVLAAYNFPWNVHFTDGVHTVSTQLSSQSQYGGSTSSSTNSEDAFTFGAPSSYGVPTTLARTEDSLTETGTDSGSTTDSDAVGSITKTRQNTYSYVQQLAGKRTLGDLISAARGDLGAATANELEAKIAGVGEDDLQVPQLTAYASAARSTREVSGSQYDYSFEYRVPAGITKGLSPVTLNWFEVTRHYDEDDYSSVQMSATPRSATLLPGESTGTFSLHPLDDFSGGHTDVSTVLSGYVNTSNGQTIERITPTTLPPFVNCYISNAQTDVVIDHEEQTATIKLQGIVSDQIAAALPLGGGADIQTVDIYVNGGLAAEDVPLVRENWGYGDIAGHYHFDPVTVDASLSENIIIEIETSENLVGKTGRYGMTLHFEPVLGDAPEAQPRSIHALLQLPAAFNPEVADVITVLPITGSGPGVAAVETDIDSRVFVTEDGYTVSVPDGYVATSAAQTIQCFIPTTGSEGSAESADTGVLLPGGSSMVCAETGSGTNLFAYNEETEGFELPAPVVDWTYSGVWNSSFSSDGGDYAPFSYSVGGYWNPGELKIAAFAGAPLLSTAATSMPRFQNGRAFEAFVIPNADGTGYDLLYANHDAGTVTRTPYTGALTAQVELGGSSATGASIDLWTVAWVDLDGQPTNGPNKMTAAALASYVARADHDGIEIPDDACARVTVTGLLNGYGVKVASSEAVDSFTLVPEGQMPTGNAIVSRLAPLESTGASSWRSLHKIIIYQSSPDADLLTNQEWNALRDAGYIAVHNISVVAGIVAVGASGASIVKAVAALDDHHLFQTFLGSTDPTYTAAKVTQFWKSLGINPDDYTVPWDKAIHRRSHKLNNSEITGITARWKNFFSQYMSPSGAVDLSKGSKLEIAEKAFKEALGQAKDFKIPIHLMKPYQKTGSTLKRFVQHHLSVAKGVTSRAGRILFLSSYREVIQNAREQLGKRAASIAFKSLNPIAKTVIIGVALSDPYGALAAETGYPRETWIDLNNYYFQDRDADDPPPSEQDSVILPDGNAICVGMPWRLYEYTEVSRPVHPGSTTVSLYPRVDKVLDCIVTHVYPHPSKSHGQGTPVEIHVQYTDPYTSLKYRHRLPSLIHGSQPESWFDYQEGDVIMSSEGGLVYFYQVPTQ